MIKKWLCLMYVSLKLLQGKNKHSAKLKVKYIILPNILSNLLEQNYKYGRPISRQLYTCDLIHGQASYM